MSQVQISAGLVKELRDLTGAGMMDAKRALEETGGDVEAAQRLLREQGMAAAGKKAGRETTEGEVLATVSGNVGAIVAIGCETEPVSKNEEFLRFAEAVLEAVEADGPDAVAGLEEQRLELVGRLKENIEIRGATRMEAGEGELLAEYVHPPANKIGVLVKAEGPPEAARRLAMHIAFAAPRFATRDEVPGDEVAKEREIYAKLPEVESKPEQAREKIVEGMLGKRFFAENVLAEQAWIHEPKKTVAQALEEEGLNVLEFERYALAE
jgi:elongation factor Ts